MQPDAYGYRHYSRVLLKSKINVTILENLQVLYECLDLDARTKHEKKRKQRDLSDMIIKHSSSHIWEPLR